METIRRLVDRQNVIDAIESELSIFDSVCYPTNNAPKIWSCTFLITNKTKSKLQILKNNRLIYS